MKDPIGRNNLWSWNFGNLREKNEQIKKRRFYNINKVDFINNIHFYLKLSTFQEHMAHLANRSLNVLTKQEPAGFKD